MTNHSQEELEVNREVVRSVGDRLQITIQNLETKARQLTSAYIVFQGIIFLAITNSSLALRIKWWIPFSLTLSVSIVFWLGITGTFVACLRLQRHYDLTLMEQVMINHEICLTRSGWTQTDDESGDQRQPWKELKPDPLLLYRRYAYVFLIIFALFAFTVVMLYASHSMLRDGKD